MHKDKAASQKYHREYYQANKEHYKELKRIYRHENRDAVNATARAWHNKNKDRINAQNRARRAAARKERLKNQPVVVKEIPVPASKPIYDFATGTTRKVYK